MIYLLAAILGGGTAFYGLWLIVGHHRDYSDPWERYGSPWADDDF